MENSEFNEYLKAAERGNDIAMYSIGCRYKNGKGIKQDYEKAMEWYLKAIDIGGNIDAIVAIGYMYYNGEGVKQDYSEAFKWYLKAAKLGHATAMYYIGKMYSDGEGVEQDNEKAMEWGQESGVMSHMFYRSSLHEAMDKSNPSQIHYYIIYQVNKLEEKLEEKHKRIENKIDTIMSHIEAMSDGPLMKEALEDFIEKSTK